MQYQEKEFGKQFPCKVVRESKLYRFPILASQKMQQQQPKKKNAIMGKRGREQGKRPDSCQSIWLARQAGWGQISQDFKLCRIYLKIKEFLEFFSLQFSSFSSLCARKAETDRRTDGFDEPGGIGMHIKVKLFCAVAQPASLPARLPPPLQFLHKIPEMICQLRKDHVAIQPTDPPTNQLRHPLCSLGGGGNPTAC